MIGQRLQRFSVRCGGCLGLGQKPVVIPKNCSLNLWNRGLQLVFDTGYRPTPSACLPTEDRIRIAEGVYGCQKCGKPFLRCGSAARENPEMKLFLGLRSWRQLGSGNVIKPTGGRETRRHDLPEAVNPPCDSGNALGEIQ